MGRYNKLQKDYENLELMYEKQVADNLDLQHMYDELKEEYEEDKRQKEDIEKLHENTRRLKHDMKNHIMVVASYLNNGEYDRAKDYLSVIMDNLNKVYSYIQTGNSVLNYIVNLKLESAHKKGIKFKAEIENLAFKNIGSVDFSALLGNALDNAIEAEEMIDDGYIYVGILKKRGYDTILIKNKIESSVLNNNSSLESRKKDKSAHGYGIKQMREITEKSDGIIDIYEEAEMFCVNILIPANE